MLWLAGLMGAAGVGAAAFVGVKADTAEDEDDTALEETAHTEGADDLLSQIRDHSDAGGALQANPAPAPSDNSATQTSGGWDDDVLDDVMKAFDTGTEAPADPGTPAQETVYSSAMLTSDEVDTGDDTPEDEALLSDWIDQRVGTEVLDYEAHTESLMLVWDDTSDGAEEPTVDVAPNPDDPEVINVSMNGENVAEIYGDSNLSVADLTLIPLSSAMAIGLEAV